MSANSIAPVQAVPVPSRLGQGTAVEQSRAIAEVQAAIVVAQQCPRNVQAALAQMRDGCAQAELANRAFYSYRRGGQVVTGGSVHLARELARCWGNIQYGLVELRRDDDEGQSEMLAFAWDVQTNTRPSTTFIVPHLRDKQGGPQKLTDVRDIYENNANMGSRRVREQIFAVLPPWFVAEASNLCHATLENGGGVPLHKRIANCVALFEALGVPVERLERHVGRASSDWSAQNVAQLGITYTSITRNEIRLEEVFPAEDAVVSAADVQATSKRQPRKGATPPAPPSPAPAQEDAPADGFDPTLEPGFLGGES